MQCCRYSFTLNKQQLSLQRKVMLRRHFEFPFFRGGLGLVWTQRRTGRMSNRANVECRVSSVECRVSSVECRVSSVECRVSSVECRVSSVECRVSSVECRVSNVEFQFIISTLVF